MNFIDTFLNKTLERFNKMGALFLIVSQYIFRLENTAQNVPSNAGRCHLDFEDVFPI